jgi:hypothetical protein
VGDPLGVIDTSGGQANVRRPSRRSEIFPILPRISEMPINSGVFTRCVEIRRSCRF